MYFRLLIWMALILIGFPVLADTAIGYRLSANSSQANDTSIFNVTESNDGFSHRLFNELYAKLQFKGINLVATYNVNITDEHDVEKDSLLNEVYYDFSAKGLDFTIGKKVLSWGVGYGYRPLDLIQQENRRALNALNLEGVTMSSSAFYTGNTAISLLIANRTLLAERKYQDEFETGIKIYSLYDDWDLHGLVHYSETFGASLGFGFATVVGEGFELHASSIYRSRYHKYINGLIETNETLAQADPIYEKKYYDCVNAVLGFTWTFQSRISIIGEAWHDCTAHTHAEWAAMRDLTKLQQSLLSSLLPPEQSATENQIQGNQRYFSGSNLLQNSVFARLSYEGEKTVPYIDLLVTPDDGGIVISASVSHEARQNISLFTSARYFTGRSGSAFKQLSDQAIIYLGFRAEFVM